MNWPDRFLAIVRDPTLAAGLTEAEWDTFLPMARRQKLHVRIAMQLDGLGLLDAAPGPVRRNLVAFRNVAAAHERSMRWEVDRIAHALRDVGAPVVLLKGAAYVMAGLPSAPGRITTDVDILVPREALAAVEAALLARDWQPVKVDDYDQQYYRRWMHELPPLRHRDRHAVVDVHHTILPETHRLRPDPAALLRDARPVEGVPGVQVLAPEDMVLHAAAHLFQDGDFEGGLRDLVDLDVLLRHFGADEDFYARLAARAREQDLELPLRQLVHFATRLLETPCGGLAGGASPRLDRLVATALRPAAPGVRSRRRGFRLWQLYLRSHWLRMPPLLLARHLLTKSVRGLRRDDQPSAPR